MLLGLGIGALGLMAGLTGCAGGAHQRSSAFIDYRPTAPNASDPSPYSQIEDRRTAERVREALAAAADYKYDGVKVLACNGAIELSGFVDTSAQRHRAGAIASKVVGVNSVKNDLTVND